MAEIAPLDDIIATVTELAAAEFGRPAAELTADLDLSTVEGADSVKVLRVIAKIERAYDIELEDDDVFGFKTINDVAASVRSTLAEQAA